MNFEIFGIALWGFYKILLMCLCSDLKKQTKEWEARFKKKCVKMVPRMVGPYYLSADMDPSKPVELIQLSAVFLCDTSQPIQVFSVSDSCLNIW